MYDKDSNIVTKTKDFNLAIKKHRDGTYLLGSGEYVYTCMTSDFFIEEADEWRPRVWEMIRLRKDVDFCIITKRIERFNDCIPLDWGNGYDNVTICATCENQKMAEERLPLLLNLPIKHRKIIQEPILEEMNIEKYLSSGKIELVISGGESGPNARPCNYDWILSTRKQCLKYNVPFYFKQTGANFIKDGRKYNIPRMLQLKQAKMANINT